MEERKMILKMIEDGKITAEEGVQLLEAIERRGKNEFQDAAEKFMHQANKGATKLFDLVGKAIQKVQELDLDFDLPFHSGVKVKETIELSSFDYDQLSFSTTTGHIRCQKWDQQGAKIEITGHVLQEKEEFEALRKIREAIQLKTEDKKYAFSLLDEKGLRVTIDLFLPSRVFEAVHLETTHGNVQLGALKSDRLEIKAVNGSIRIEKVSASELGVTTSNGRVQLNQVEIEQGKIQSSNGSIHASGHFHSLQCETTNGTIRVKQEKISDSQLKAFTHNGSIRLFYPRDIQGVYGELKTNYGNLQCLLKGTEMKEEQEGERYKNITFSQGEEKNHHVLAESKTGSVHILEKEEVDELF